MKPFLFEHNKTPYVIFAPTKTIATEHNRVMRYAGKLVGIDSRTSKQQENTPVMAIVKESQSALRVRLYIKSSDLVMPDWATDQMIDAFVDKVSRFNDDNLYKLIDSQSSVNEFMLKIKNNYF